MFLVVERRHFDTRWSQWTSTPPRSTIALPPLLSKWQPKIHWTCYDPTRYPFLHPPNPQSGVSPTSPSNFGLDFRYDVSFVVTRHILAFRRDRNTFRIWNLSFSEISLSNMYFQWPNALYKARQPSTGETRAGESISDVVLAFWAIPEVWGGKRGKLTSHAGKFFADLTVSVT